MPEGVRRVRLMLAISWRADRWRSIGTLLTAVGQTASMPLRAIGIAVLADGVVSHDMARAMAGVVVIVVLSALNRLCTWWSMAFRMRLRENTQLYLDSYLMQLTAGIPGIAHHELPDYLDRLELIRRERHYLANPFNPISWTFASIVATVGMVAMLAGVQPLLALLPLAAIPACVATGRFEQEQVALMERQAEDSRVLRHLSELAILPAAAKELRVFGLSAEVLQRHQGLFSRLERERLSLVIRRSRRVALGWGLFAVAYTSAVAYTAHLAQTGARTVGSAVLVLSLGSQMNQVLSEFAWNTSWFVQSQRAAGRLLWFTAYVKSATEDATPACPVPVPTVLRGGIEIRDLEFAYPGATMAALAEVNLVLPAGSTVAIVGENGAGKTTLVKLLTRMYEPTAGTILVDGQPLSSFAVEEWRSRISAGFQDFARLELLARESIGTGDTTLIHSDPHLSAALGRAAAATLPRALPDGFDTQLGRAFDGTDLSIGQWQKIALARAMMREEPLLLVLDEPTASLDAPTEHALFERFVGAARSVAERTGGITVLVSHRFSTVRMADQIVVVGHGQVLERGSHETLMSANGVYAELYRLQAHAYQ